MPYALWAATVEAFGVAEADIALCVARNETRLVPGSVGAEGEGGPWQLHPVNWAHYGITSAEQLEDYALAARTAADLRHRDPRGWAGPWPRTAPPCLP